MSQSIDFKQDLDNINNTRNKPVTAMSLHLLSPNNVGLMSAAKSLSLSPRYLAPPMTLSLQKSTAITKGFFHTEIMKKIEKGNSLDLTKVSIDKQVGRGGDAFVFYAKYNGNIEIALKEYKFKADKFNDDTLMHFENELNILQSLKHENIIGFLGYHLNIKNKELKFAFEYCHFGNLFNKIHPINIDIENAYFKYNDILQIALDIAKGMKYLHGERIIHRDLNPRNVLIFDGKKTKITDFGESIIIGKDDDFERPKIVDKHSIGSFGYKSPEMIRINARNGYNYKIDVFSFGSLCFELITRKFASGQSELKDYEKMIEKDHYMLIPEDCNEKFGQLMYECWQFEAKERPNFNKIVDYLELMIVEQKDNNK